MGRPRKEPAPAAPSQPNHELRSALAAAERSDEKFMAEVLMRIRYEQYSRWITIAHFKKLRALATFDLFAGLNDEGILVANPEIFNGADDFAKMRLSTKYRRLKNALKKKAKQIAELRAEEDPKKMLEASALIAVQTIRDEMIHNPNSEAALDASTEVLSRTNPKPTRQTGTGGKVIVIGEELMKQLSTAHQETKQLSDGAIEVGVGGGSSHSSVHG